MRVFKGVRTTDGAGVKLTRYIGTHYLREHDPFLLLDEFKSSDPEDYMAGFPEHPHRGFQTLTYIVRGKLRHRDSTGSEGVLEEGYLQWMNAGSGVIHSEMPLSERGIWGFQLWLNNPSKLKLSEPFYVNYKAKTLIESESLVVIDLVGDVYREKGFYPLTYLHIRLAKDTLYETELPESNNHFLLVSEGCVELNSTYVEEGHIALPQEGKLSIRALEKSEILVCSAVPLREPVARWGPFVMNTKEEIEQAIRDFGIY